MLRRPPVLPLPCRHADGEACPIGVQDRVPARPKFRHSHHGDFPASAGLTHLELCTLVPSPMKSDANRVPSPLKASKDGQPRNSDRSPILVALPHPVVPLEAAEVRVVGLLLIQQLEAPRRRVPPPRRLAPGPCRRRRACGGVDRGWPRPPLAWRRPGCAVQRPRARPARRRAGPPWRLLRRASARTACQRLSAVPSTGPRRRCRWSSMRPCAAGPACRKRYHAEGGRASTGSSARNRRTSAARPLAVS